MRKRGSQIECHFFIDFKELKFDSRPPRGGVD
jgi:hypothetical protein